MFRFGLAPLTLLGPTGLELFIKLFPYFVAIAPYQWRFWTSIPFHLELKRLEHRDGYEIGKNIQQKPPQLAAIPTRIEAPNVEENPIVRSGLVYIVLFTFDDQIEGKEAWKNKEYQLMHRNDLFRKVKSFPRFSFIVFFNYFESLFRDRLTTSQFIER